MNTVCIKVGFVLCILFFPSILNAQTKRSFRVGINASFHEGTAVQKRKFIPFVFFDRGLAAGLDLSIGSKRGRRSTRIAIEYLQGRNNMQSITHYAILHYLPQYGFYVTGKHPKGLNITFGPQWTLLRKQKTNPIILFDLTAGISISNRQLVYRGLPNGEYEPMIGTTTIRILYHPSVAINIAKFKKTNLQLRCGYSNWGGINVGIGASTQYNGLGLSGTLFSPEDGAE